MNLVRSGLVGLLMMAPGVAGAADLYKPAAVPPPVVPYVLGFSWTGFYVGAQIGYGFAGDDRVGIHSSFPPGGRTFLGDAGDLENNGFFGGVHIGYNWNWGGLLLGLEAELNVSGVGDDFRTFVPPGGFDAIRASSDINWYGVIGPRIGWAWDRLLIYGTGGFAFGQVDYDVRGVSAVDSFRISDDDTYTGWALGAGLEYAFSPNWTARVEYKYINLGSQWLHGDVVDLAGVPTGERISTKATPDFHSVKFGVSYKFGYEAPPPAPAVVKY